MYWFPSRDYEGDVLSNNLKYAECSMNKDNYSICDECGSEFLKSTSKMMALCPECAYVLYGYPNCAHDFKNGRCIYCYWDGSQSEYIKWLKGNG